MMKPNWAVRPTVPDDVVAELGFPRLQSQLLYNRGLTSRTVAERFLSPSAADSHDPRLLPDVDAAVSRLTRAIEDGELIGVFGDFDIDGISGVAVMAIGLRELGANVLPYIPDRKDEGHGLTVGAIESRAQRGVSALVTVDCGYDSESDIDLAKSLGMDTIITDHHVVDDGPPYPVAALVNPMRPDSEYPFPHLTGSGMAYKLMQAMHESAGREEPRHLLALAALGTIGDVGPLVGENRYIVSEGIRRMNADRSAGLAALARVSGLGDRNIDAESLKFQIIPRLNAPGRLADAGISLDLLVAEAEDDAQRMASILDEINTERKEKTAKGVEEAERQVEVRMRKSWNGSLPGVIMVGHRGWGHGIVGLIAARLTDTYGRPAIAVAVEDTLSRASARSVSGFNILDAIKRSGHLLTKFGGHAQAAGFTVATEKLGELAAAFDSIPSDAAGGEPDIPIDICAAPSLVERELFEFTERLAPFGKSNPKPTFAASSLTVIDSRQVGGSGDHLKLRLHDGQEEWDAIAFRQGSRIEDAGTGSEIDVAYQMERNTWNGRTRMQLLIEDLAPSR